MRKSEKGKTIENIRLGIKTFHLRCRASIQRKLILPKKLRGEK